MWVYENVNIHQKVRHECEGEMVVHVLLKLLCNLLVYSLQISIKNAQLGCITVQKPLRLIIKFFKNGDLRSFLLTIHKMVHDAKIVQSFRVQNVKL